MWNTDNGASVKTAWDVGFSVPVLAVSWHPKDHMIALAALGPQQPVLVLTWDAEYDPQQPEEVRAVPFPFPVMPGG